MEVRDGEADQVVGAPPAHGAECMTTRAGYLAGMDAHLKKWDEDVEAFESECERASIALVIAHRKRITDLRACREAAHQTFQKIRTASDPPKEEFRGEMQSALERMQKDLDKVSSQLKTVIETFNDPKGERR